MGITRFRIGTVRGTAIKMPATQMVSACLLRAFFAPAAHPAHCDQLEVFSTEQEAVDEPEDEGRERRDQVLVIEQERGSQLVHIFNMTFVLTFVNYDTAYSLPYGRSVNSSPAVAEIS